MKRSISGMAFFKRSGFTLVELLIATTITLLILLTMLRAFVVANREIKIGRNRVISAERIQKAADLIREDLSKLSIPINTRRSEVAQQGYFLYVDGPLRDQSSVLTVQGPGQRNNSVIGDLDDVLMFTAVSKGKPFRGRFNNQIIESQAAEIIYWTELVRDNNLNGFADYGDQVRLYRRVLLIRPDLNGQAISQAMLANSNSGGITGSQSASHYAKNFYYNNDVSVSTASILRAGSPVPDGSGGLFFEVTANSLASLSKLENRTCHYSWDPTNVTGRPFPYVVYRTQPGLRNPLHTLGSTTLPSSEPNTSPTFPSLEPSPLGVLHGLPAAPGAVPVTLSDLQYAVTTVYSDDGSTSQVELIPIEGISVLDNALAFDVQVFDPDVPVFSSAASSNSIKPNDPGYLQAISGVGGFNLAGYGAYIDLGSYLFMENAVAVPDNLDGTVANFNSGMNESQDITGVSVYNNDAFQKRHPAFAFWWAIDEKESDRQLSDSVSSPPVAYSATSTRFQNKLNSRTKVPFMYRGPVFDTMGNLSGFLQIMGPTYTTFPGNYYEKNKIDENGNGVIDDGTDGNPEYDLNGNALSPGVPYLDRDAIPPYDLPVRAIKITIRTGSFNADTQVISASDQVLQRQIEVATRGK